MQTTLGFSPPAISKDKDDDEKSEDTCPVCGAKWVKKEPTLSNVRSAIRESIEPHQSEIKALDESSLFGYCGSVATGAVGQHKPHKGLQPDIRGECGTKYDVDGFLISDPVAKKIPKFKGKRWAYKNKDTRDIEKNIRQTLKSKPALEHMKPGKSGFSVVVYTNSEQEKVIRKGCIVVIH